MDYRKYSREVIVLEEKNREFADKPGEEMKGYLRVETGSEKGAIRCVMQNVKWFSKSEYTYQLILFGNRGEKTIHAILGTVPVNRYGTGEVYLRFRPGDVDGEGNDYGRYSTVIVAAVSSKDPTEQLHPVLMGKTGNPSVEEEVSSLKLVSQETNGSEKRTFNHYYGEYLKHVCSYLWTVKEYYRELKIFDQNEEEDHKEFASKYITWLKIPDPDSMFLVSQGAKHFAKKYGHFILGRDCKDDVSYYVGVPGRMCKEDQPDGGESGFCLWLPVGKEPYGYWILRIDGKKGDIYSCEIT